MRALGQVVENHIDGAYRVSRDCGKSRSWLALPTPTMMNCAQVASDSVVVFAVGGHLLVTGHASSRGQDPAGVAGNSGAGEGISRASRASKWIHRASIFWCSKDVIARKPNTAGRKGGRVHATEH